MKRFYPIWKKTSDFSQKHPGSLGILIISLPIIVIIARDVPEIGALCAFCSVGWASIAFMFEILFPKGWREMDKKRFASQLSPNNTTDSRKK